MRALSGAALVAFPFVRPGLGSTELFTPAQDGMGNGVNELSRSFSTNTRLFKPPKPTRALSHASKELPQSRTSKEGPISKERLDERSTVPERPGSQTEHVVVSRAKPMRYAFPATPLHASMFLVLRLETPTTATRFEHARDSVLRSLSHPAFDFLAGVWAMIFLPWAVLVGVLYLGLYSGSRAERESLEALALHVLTGLFSWMHALPMPWRVANAIQLGFCAARPECHPIGHDWYGRSTAALWFHLTLPQRRRIIILLLLSAVCHYVQQIGRLIWPTYEASNQLLPALIINLGFGLSVVFGIVAGALQGHGEGQARARAEVPFPPAPLDYVLAAFREWRSAQGSGSFLSFLWQKESAFVHDVQRYDRSWRWMQGSSGILQARTRMQSIWERGRKSSIAFGERETKMWTDERRWDDMPPQFAPVTRPEVAHV